jgi:hypothetical protein
MRALLIVSLVVALGVGTYVWTCESRKDAKIGPAAAASSPADDKFVPPSPWPPVLGQTFPDMELVDQDGAATRLSQFKGKILIVEPVGMGCPGCQAFSGANDGAGPYGGGSAQQGLGSFDVLAKKYGQLDPTDGRIVLVQLLLYDMTNGKAPVAADAKKWADHFGFTRAKNRVVLAGVPKLVNQASYEMIPGFFLVDREFVLRADSTGHNPKDSFYEKLLPMLAGMLK